MHNILDNLDYVSQRIEIALHRLWLEPSQDDIDEAETALVVARTYLNKAKNNACDMGYRLGEGEPSSAPRYSKLKEISPDD